MTRSSLTIFKNDKFQIKELSKFYVVKFHDKRIFYVNKNDYSFNPPIDDMVTRTEILEIIERKQKKKFTNRFSGRGKYNGS